jgi:hypothetical protein
MLLRISTDESGRVIGGPVSAVGALQTVKTEGDGLANYQDTRLLRSFPLETQFATTGESFIIRCELRVPPGSQQGWSGLLSKQKQSTGTTAPAVAAKDLRKTTGKKDKGSRNPPRRKSTEPPASSDLPLAQGSTAGNGQKGFCLGFNGDLPGTLRLDIGCSRNDVIRVSNKTKVDDGKWHSIVAKVSSTAVSLEIDGEDQNLRINSMTHGILEQEVADVNLVIGDDPFGANRKLFGELKGISIKQVASVADSDRDQSSYFGGKRLNTWSDSAQSSKASKKSKQWVQQRLDGQLSGGYVFCDMR